MMRTKTYYVNAITNVLSLQLPDRLAPTQKISLNIIVGKERDINIENNIDIAPCGNAYGNHAPCLFVPVCCENALRAMNCKPTDYIQTKKSSKKTSNKISNKSVYDEASTVLEEINFNNVEKEISSPV